MTMVKKRIEIVIEKNNACDSKHKLETQGSTWVKGKKYYDFFELNHPGLTKWLRVIPPECIGGSTFLSTSCTISAMNQK